MQKEILNENRSKLILAVVSLFVLLIIYFSLKGIYGLQVENNDRKVNEILNELTYTEENAESELTKLNKILDITPLSDKVKGNLYKACAEVLYMTGDEMMYNKRIADALFYLKKAGDEESCVYLENKYIGRLYSNGCYETALTILLQIPKEYEVSELSLELQANYYLSLADVSQQEGENASSALDKAESAIKLMPENGKKKLNKAKLDILAARQYINQKNFNKAKEIMSSYSESDDFGLGKNQVYVVCDFTIPYYEIMSKLSLADGNYKKMELYADKYIEECDAYQFRTMKLNLLKYITDNYGNAESKGMDKYHIMVAEAAETNLSDLTDEYGEFLIVDIEAEEAKVQSIEDDNDRYSDYIDITFIVLYLLILIYCSIGIFLNFNNKDALTKLNNRKKYEKIRIVCEKKKLSYCLIMIDIDDFKKVNDTFGHEQGDKVLERISGIIRSYGGRGIFNYRYGGEELCMMLVNVPEKRAKEIAEEVRNRIEKCTWDEDMRITVSIGIGISHAGENVFQQADRKLYEAKKNGKNKVCI